MRKIHFLALAFFLIPASWLTAQESAGTRANVRTPYAGILFGGCGASNPVSFLAGIQQTPKTHFSILYDIHYWNTRYKDYSDNVYSRGHFSSLTPSIKFIYSTGKKPGNGLFAGIGLGYMIARDRGTEQPYTLDPFSNAMTVNDKDIVTGRWDFNSVSPSLVYGIGFRLFHFPVALNNTYYFAKTTKGWDAVTGGIGLKMGFRR
ncbi:MAG: hypothetical protein Q8941_14845 [Bacteroidota bacterium]|nr:hypothetical protein [Bacteroidota bacterium]